MRKLIRSIKELPTHAARVSTAALGKTHYSRWEKNAKEKPSWDERNVVLARHIPEKSRVLDLGAGAQTLRRYLSTCEYVPCDLVKSTPDCIVCDFNAGQYPKADRRFDVVICSGVIEYIREPLVFLQNLRPYAPTVIISYQPTRLDDKNDKMNRMASGFLNHFQREEIEKLFAAAGFRHEQVDTWKVQLIFRLTHG